MAQWEACERKIYAQSWGSVPSSLGQGFRPGTGTIKLIDFPVCIYIGLLLEYMFTGYIMQSSLNIA